MSKRILIVGPSWVGDMVMAQTLFKLIKERQPNAIIDVLASSWTFALLSCMPQVSQTIANPLSHGEFNLSLRYQIGKSLRPNKYDQAIVLPNSFKAALIPWFANIPLRTGWLREFRYGLLNDSRRLDKKRYPLMIEQYMALGLPANEKLPHPYPQPDFFVSEIEQQKILAKFNLQLNEQPVLALCAGAQYGAAKRWPVEYFAKIAKQKLQEGWRVWLFGSPAEQPVTATIMELTNDKCENLAGRLALNETIALMSVTSGVIANDSGLMHIAAALQKPLIAIYGSTSPHFTPPLSKTATILKLNLDCQPCFQRECPLKHHRCMRELLPEQALLVMNGWKV